ncbi:Phenylacetic acid degradation operon negative regulatory protein PaaX [Patulibacter medicamentivorans]|uniref:Phenylacetic acid degradation operon negative regulatory protein PaaX n=1 Tax=Patulibacter medicamentivorans TaxID=1097667 RepID=H0E002_9ACTN|nr:PaaX family transcriptional regulator C-terminal domain-containing protein [Patulibacter medicamentivorans]EHN12961.1 Phenylacetic acid degradation operon negative regulatory protein PaaX [Patulibacter medicamentivorans]
MAADGAPLQPQDLVLTILGAHLRDPRATVWSGGAVELLTEFGFSIEAARAALARLAGRGLLARHKQGRLAFYSLTNRADELLSDGDRRIFGFGRAARANDLWTIVWHAMPEAERVARSRLASRLRFLGFGSVQDSTWIAARDREPEATALLRSLGIESFASVFVGRLSRGLSPTAIVAQAWDLDAVDRQYRAFIDAYAPFRAAEQQAALTPREAFLIRTAMLHRFRFFPALDPELPPEVDAVGELREDVVALFDALYEGLAEAADAHFHGVAQQERLVLDREAPESPR